MDILNILLIALGLSMDAVAVSIASGIAIRNLKIGHALKIAGFFGFFQALMPVIGWLLGSAFSAAIEKFDHWVAFGLLALIGGKMVYESFSGKDEGPKGDPLKLPVLLLMSVATSIDALAVGLSFAVLKTPLFPPVLIIGLTTFVLSFAAALGGKKLGAVMEKRAELIGGLVLLGIGLKILVEHLAAGK